MFRLNRRLATVLAAPVAALATWGVFRLAGLDLVLKHGRGTVGAADVVVAAVVAALLGWVVVRLLEDHSRKPLARWPLVGAAALGTSMIGPGWFADGASAMGLMTLHLVTGAVVIVGLAATLPARRGRRPRVPASQRSGTMRA
jgi:hypothetical protein